MTRMPGLGGRGGSGGADAGWGEAAGACAGAWEVVALPSTLACSGPGAGLPLFLRARFGLTGGVGVGRAWAWIKACVACWLRSRSGGSAGVWMVAFVQFCVRLGSFCTVSGGSVGHGSADGLSPKGWWRW